MTFKLPDGRTIRVLFHACEVRNPSCLLVVSLSRGTGVIFAQTLDKIQMKHSQTQLHREESLFFVKGMLVAPLLTVGVSDEVASRVCRLVRKCWTMIKTETGRIIQSEICGTRIDQTVNSDADFFAGTPKLTTFCADFSR